MHPRPHPPPPHPLSRGFNLTIAAFGNRAGTFTLLRVDQGTYECAAAEAVARGLDYSGYFGVVDGYAQVEVEPGFEATMVLAGVAFAETLGPLLQQHQRAMRLEQAAG